MQNKKLKNVMNNLKKFLKMQTHHCMMEIKKLNY